MLHHTYTIGVVAPFLTGPYHAAVLAGIHAATHEAGARVLAIQGTPGEIAGVQLSYDYVDAWVVVADADGIAALAAERPVVLIGSQAPGVPCILADNSGGVRTAVAHLIEHGHTRIAFFGHLAIPDIAQRYDGYVAALAEHTIALDPQLVYDCGGYSELQGREAMRMLIQSGQHYTAVMAATDATAFGVINALHEAGLRIPEDVAVVGFDDVPQAQYTDPPLTTVRQRPETLGQHAVRLVLDWLAGFPPPDTPTIVPTALIARRSCNCSNLTLGAATPQAEDRYQSSNWQETLAQDLVRLILAPLPYDPAIPVSQVWPGAGELVAALAALDDHQPPLLSPEPWNQAVRHTDNLQTLYGVLELLETAGRQRAAGDPDAAARLATLLSQMQMALAQAHQLYVAERVVWYRALHQLNHEVLFELVATERGGAQALRWLGPTSVRWAVLALWDADQPNTLLKIVGTYQRDHSDLPFTNTISAAAFPPLGKLPASAPEQPQLIKLVPVQTATRRWGLLAYCEPFVDTDYDTVLMWAALLAATLERDTLIGELTERQESMRAAYERERALADTIRELGCPLIPLLPDVLLVPLVGAIDAQRATQIVERILEGVSREQAETVLLDITGVPLVDTQVAAALVQTTRAVGLLGARVVLVGVRPEIAQSIISLGVDLGTLETRPNLASAVQALIQSKA